MYLYKEKKTNSLTRGDRSIRQSQTDMLCAKTRKSRYEQGTEFLVTFLVSSHKLDAPISTGCSVGAVSMFNSAGTSESRDCEA